MAITNPTEASLDVLSFLIRRDEREMIRKICTNIYTHK